MENNSKIIIKGARQHNLKNIDVDIPKNKIVVFSGVSGSGKSSLAFDTIYAEGQRRYVESLSTYARQFLGIMDKPDVDSIVGLSPSIAIDQKTTSKNPRSTVGTITEIYDYLRLLYSRVGHPHCPVCGREISSQSVDEIADSIDKYIKEYLSLNDFVRFFILSPIVKDKKGEFISLFDNLKSKGYLQIRIDGQIRDLSDDIYLLKNNRHSIDVVVDKISLNKKDMKNKIFINNFKSRMLSAIVQSLKLSDGLVSITYIKDKSLEFPKYPKTFEDHIFSERFSCPVDNLSISEIEPRTFSFNSPHGACMTCKGIGTILKADAALLFSYDLSISEGGILPFSTLFEKNTWYSRIILQFCQDNAINIKSPIKNIEKDKIDLLLKGTGDKLYEVYGENRMGENTVIYEKFEGLLHDLETRYETTQSDVVREITKKYLREKVCPECNGSRLNKEALNITIEGKTIAEVSDLPISQTILWIDNLPSIISDKEKQIGGLIISEIQKRLNFLNSVGLEYLSLSRASASLSGGESQRIRLASQIGSGLSGVIYVLDEPTIGLHQVDNIKLIKTLKMLRDLGNTVIVVEHDREMIINSDYIINFGPGAGKNGGLVDGIGEINDFLDKSQTSTAKYIRGNNKIHIEKSRQSLDGKANETKYLTISGCKQYNLKDLDVKFPLKHLVAVTGVSGSGKSTLLVDTLYPAVYKKINKYSKIQIGEHRSISGYENINKVILVDQSPIGRTPRSNPATYTKIFDDIREVFASLKESKVLGYKKGMFSFNLKGGRCEACEGQGQIKIEMQFMSDVWVNCEVCKGKRYNNQTLEIEYHGKNISEILKMSVTESFEFFHNYPKIVSKLATLKSVGLDYMELGQPATTLSGGEAQRIKLALELSKKESGNTLYIMDEPTTGLHFEDIQKLLNVLRQLVDKGNSVFIIEHNIDVIKNCDWIIDLGPEGGEKGGYLLDAGTVDHITKDKYSSTSIALNMHN